MNYRKPLNIGLYYMLLVKTNGIWHIDCETWDESVVKQAFKIEKRFNPSKQTKIVTSPSDENQVVTRIVKELNRYAKVN